MIQAMPINVAWLLVVLHLAKWRPTKLMLKRLLVA